MVQSSADDFRSSPRWWAVVSVLLVFPGAGLAADLYVDPVQGNDAADGSTQPVKTIAAAIRRAVPGDTIHLQPETRYRDWAAFFDKAGEPGKPITLDGHGATLDGCDPLDPADWKETEPGLFRHDDLLPLTQAIIDRWFFVMNGQLNRMRRCSKGPSEPLKESRNLQPGEWTFVKDEERSAKARPGYIHGTFWLKLAPGQSLGEAGIEVPLRPAGVLIHGKSAHLVIRNLTSTRPYNDGFNLADCQDVRFENIRAIHCGDDGISAHGYCKYTVEGFTSIGNATGICDTGTSETSYRNAIIRDCIGFDLYFLGSGTYALRDSEIISSAARALHLQGDPTPAGPCRVMLENVLLRREQTTNEVRVSPNCLLQCKRVTLLNLDLQATGGEIDIQQSFIGGSIPGEPARPPRMHLWKDAKWSGHGNWYDLESVRVAQETYTARTYVEFTQTVTADRESRWTPATEEAVRAAGIGAVLPGNR